FSLRQKITSLRVAESRLRQKIVSLRLGPLSLRQKNVSLRVAVEFYPLWSSVAPVGSHWRPVGSHADPVGELFFGSMLNWRGRGRNARWRGEAPPLARAEGYRGPRLLSAAGSERLDVLLPRASVRGLRC